MKTPWGDMLRLGVSMGVAPETFWRLSLKEWRMLTAAPAGVEPLGRAALERMMEGWPDE